jgi:hypothetical protein
MVGVENDAPPGIPTYNYPTSFPFSVKWVVNHPWIKNVKGAYNAPIWDDPEHNLKSYWEHTHIPCYVYRLPMTSCEPSSE